MVPWLARLRLHRRPCCRPLLPAPALLPPRPLPRPPPPHLRRLHLLLLRHGQRRLPLLPLLLPPLPLHLLLRHGQQLLPAPALHHRLPLYRPAEAAAAVRAVAQAVRASPETLALRQRT